MGLATSGGLQLPALRLNRGSNNSSSVPVDSNGVNTTVASTALPSFPGTPIQTQSITTSTVRIT